MQASCAPPFVRYIEPDPPDAVSTQQDVLPYGVANIDAEVVWGGTQQATDVVSSQGGSGIKRCADKKSIAGSRRTQPDTMA